MLKLGHAALVFISGMVWLLVGLTLMPLGLKLLAGSSGYAVGENFPLIGLLAPYFKRVEEAALLLIVAGLFVGYMKSKYVLSKTVKRTVTRIQSFPNPTSIKNLFSLGYYILIAVMIALGASMRFFGVPNDIRGVIDVAVGAALINGALLYFRLAWSLRPKQNVA